MTIELSQERFSNGVGDFDIGHILFDTQTQRQVEIVKFSGYSEIDEETGAEHEQINVHFGGVADDLNGLIDFEDLQHAVYRDRTFEPIAPDWFVDEVKGEVEDTEAAEEARITSEQDRELGKKQLREAIGNLTERPVEHYTDTELFAKISGAPLSIAEDMFLAYEGNLARMASKHTQADAENRRNRQIPRREGYRGVGVGETACTLPRHEGEDHIAC